MSYDFNAQKIKAVEDKFLFLIDSSAYIRFEELEQLTGINLLKLLHESSKHSYYLLANEVLIELMKSPRIIPIEPFIEHIINLESAIDKNWKENRFIVEEEGQLKYILLNKISSTDYGQVLLCQNHNQLYLVSNDRKMLKSAAFVIGERCLGINKLLNKLSTIEKHMYDNVEILKRGLDDNFGKRRVI